MSEQSIIARPWKRLCARLLDLILSSCCLIGLGSIFVISHAANLHFPLLTFHVWYQAFFYFLSGGLITIIYYGLIPMLRNGQTLGKTCLKITVCYFQTNKYFLLTQKTWKDRCQTLFYHEVFISFIPFVLSAMTVLILQSFVHSLFIALLGGWSLIYLFIIVSLFVNKQHLSVNDIFAKTATVNKKALLLYQAQMTTSQQTQAVPV